MRADAPWCPSNIEFIRRINGLDSIEDVKRIVFDATYLVLGLGDVYLGAPVATPVDPRHRLVTTKYNPARTWTPDNVVGIGGAYMCIYGMEGPGGYQLFGRTCPDVEHLPRDRCVRAGKPWLLRFFDQIRFYPGVGRGAARVSRRRFSKASAVEIEPSTVPPQGLSCLRSPAMQRASQRSRRASRRPSRPSGRAGKRRHQEATAQPTTGRTISRPMPQLPPGATAVESPVPGSVWKILVEPGHDVSEGETLIIVEFDEDGDRRLRAVGGGCVREVRCAEGRPVQLGQALVIMADIAA